LFRSAIRRQGRTSPAPEDCADSPLGEIDGVSITASLGRLRLRSSRELVVNAVRSCVAARSKSCVVDLCSPSWRPFALIVGFGLT
jgi:hypothetical protein